MECICTHIPIPIFFIRFLCCQSYSERNEQAENNEEKNKKLEKSYPLSSTYKVSKILSFSCTYIHMYISTYENISFSLVQDKTKKKINK